MSFVYKESFVGEGFLLIKIINIDLQYQLHLKWFCCILCSPRCDDCLSVDIPGYDDVK